MKKKKIIRKKSRKKYAVGGPISLQTGGRNPGQPVPLGIESPDEALRRNQILMARADTKSENGYTAALDMFGQYALQTGLSMASSGAMGMMNKEPEVAAYGGEMVSMPSLSGMPNSPVEVEGEEVGKTPQGNLINFKGASHEQGGIPVSLPPGTEMFSKRIKIDGVTMANREKKRHKRSVTLEELLETDPTDAIVKNTKQRVGEVDGKEQAFDTQIQDTIRALLEARGEGDPGQEKFAYAGTVGGNPGTDVEYWNKLAQQLEGKANANSTPGFWDKLYQTINTQSTAQTNNDPAAPTNNAHNDKVANRGNYLGDMFKDFLGNVSNTTAGDAMGIYSTFKKGQVPMQTLLEEEAANTPNKNAYLNYGADSLKSFDQSKEYAERQKSDALRDVGVSSNNAISSIRNTARGVSSLRAGDLAVHQNTNEAKRKIYADADKIMMDILANKARIQESRDAQVMRGEENRDLADRQDRGSFYSNLATARLQKEDSNISIAKALNTMKTRGVTAEAMGSLFNAVEIDYKTGIMKSKEGGYVVGNANDLIAQADPAKLGISQKAWDEMDLEGKTRAIMGEKKSTKSKPK